MPRCLESLLPIIDYWVIVDTGSTDGTQKIIKDFMASKKKPGILYERPWVNFGHNRNEALELAYDHGNYILFIDADEFMVYDDNFTLPTLDKDFYYININLDNAMNYKRIQLINTHKPWKWLGAVHEVLQPSFDMTSATLDNITIKSTRDGARSKDPKKYHKDAEMLEKALLDEPNNTRYMFYLAQSYRDSEQNQKSLDTYKKRIAMGGWEEEIFWSKLQIGILHERLSSPQEEVINAYKEAFLYRPTRLEPLYYLAHYYRNIKDFQNCYNVGKIGMHIPKPKEDVLFMQNWMYEYGIALETSIGAYWINNFHACQQISLQLLQNENLPNETQKTVSRNLGFTNAKLFEQIFENNRGASK